MAMDVNTKVIVYVMLRRINKETSKAEILLRDRDVTLSMPVHYYDFPAVRVVRTGESIQRTAHNAVYEDLARTKVTPENMDLCHMRYDETHNCMRLFYLAYNHVGFPEEKHESHGCMDLVWVDYNQLPDNLTPLLLEVLNYIREGVDCSSA